MFVEKHDGATDPTVLQSLLTHTGQLREERHGEPTRLSLDLPVVCRFQSVLAHHAHSPPAGS